MPARIRLSCLVAACVAVVWAKAAGAGKPLLPQTIFSPVAPVAALSPADAFWGEATLAVPQFDTTTTPLPPNVPSLGYHITATSEFGDLVRLDGAAHFIDTITITMSSWAIHSDYPRLSPVGFTHPITLKLYDVDRSSGRPRVGKVIGSATTPFLIPWRPEPDASAPASPLRPWRAEDGRYYGGVAFNLTFDLSRLNLALPDEVIFSVSFNTQFHGDDPLIAEGPYNSLSMGVSATAPSPGTDTSPGAVYWKTADGAFYSDGGSGGVNVFRMDTGWGSHSPAIRFNNSSYGTLASLTTMLMDLKSDNPEIAAALREAGSLLAAALQRTLWENNREPRVAWGSMVFDLLAEAADELGFVASRRDPSAGQAQQAVELLVKVAQSFAETAYGDAVIAGGDSARLAQAQESLDTATTQFIGRADLAIDELGNAWREAQLAIK
jgi:hypothetical protein